MNKQGISVMAPYYNSHEENSMITQNAHIIADWKTSFVQEDRGIKIYEFYPEGPNGGSLIHFGFFGTSILGSDTTSRKTFLAAVRHQAGYYNDPWIKYPNDNAVLNKNIILNYASGWNTEIYINDILYPDLRKGSNLDFLLEGDYKLEIKFINSQNTISRSVKFSVDRTPPTFLFNNQTNFEMPENYPHEKLTTTLVETHPDYIRYHISGRFAGNIYVNEKGEIYSPIYGANYPDGKYLLLEAIDAAGNSFMQWNEFNSTTKLNLTREMQPYLEKINETNLRVSMPIFSENVIGKLQVSENFGSTWINIPFTESNTTIDREYAFYERNSSEILYRVAITADNNTHYVHNIKSYHWDNTVFSIQNHNITTYTKSYNKYEVQLTKNQVQNTSVTAHWVSDTNELIQEEFFGYSDSIDQRFLVNIPSNGSKTMTLRFVVSSTLLNWSKEFKIINVEEPPKEEIEDNVDVGVPHLLNLTSIDVSLDLVATIHVKIFSNIDQYNYFLSPESFSSLTFSIFPDQEMSVFFYDAEGYLLIEYSYLKKIDQISPVIAGDLQILLLSNEVKNYELHWKITEGAGHRHDIFQNNIHIVTQEFTNEVDVYLKLPLLEVGIYNFTIIVVDKSDNLASFTTIVEVVEDLSDYTPSKTTTTTTTSDQPTAITNSTDSTSTKKSKSPGFELNVLISSILTVSIYMRKKRISFNKKMK